MTIGRTRIKSTYILILFVSRPMRIRVGVLGNMRFEPGLYFYVGSGGKSPARRIARHARSKKKRFWHIDFLTARARVIGAIVLEASVSLECSIARSLAEVFDVIPRFGCSDCACTSHLFRVPTELNP